MPVRSFRLTGRWLGILHSIFITFSILLSTRNLRERNTKIYSRGCARNTRDHLPTLDVVCGVGVVYYFLHDLDSALSLFRPVLL